MPHIPADIMRGIADELRSLSDKRTLASLAVVSREAYEVVTPILYAELVVSARSSTGLLGLSPRDVAGFPGFDADGQCGSWEEDTAVGDAKQRRRILRRIAALSHVKRVVVRSLPPDYLAANFAAAAEALADSPMRVLLFPRLQAVSLLPDAVDALRTWTPRSYDRPHNPPFLEALSFGARPAHLCLAFRLVPSVDWESHREITTAGQYTLVRKVELLASPWALEGVTFHDIVHQVPPSVPATTNIYHFAPHVVPHPLFARRYKFPRGDAAVGLPGPEWNIRPWQMGLAVKNLFPSGHDHAGTLLGTRWEFCDLSNHVLTKAERDDDDSTGVWVGEVVDMILDSMRVGLDRDLPARGMDRDAIRSMWSRIEYTKAGECEACHRDLDEHPVMSLDG